MRILQIHNHYRVAGGEDAVVQDEAAMLRERGHEVLQYFRSNSELVRAGWLNKATALPESIWSKRTYREIRQLIAQLKPDIAHLHNRYYLVSPSVVRACAVAGLPLVMTHHNYRAVCPLGTFYTKAQVCERCRDHGSIAAVLAGCCREKTFQTVSAIGSNSLTRVQGLYRNHVAVHICLTQFQRDKLARVLPLERTVVKPNFVRCHGSIPPQNRTGVLFVGRLSAEKGVGTLLEAWRAIPDLELWIIGDGPERVALEDIVRREKLLNVHFAGWLSEAQCREAMTRARCVVIPSACYEGFPKTLVEALACATPVVASGFGSFRELIEEQGIGLVFQPGDPVDLARKVQWMQDYPGQAAAMGERGQQLATTLYSEATNCAQLLAIYNRALLEPTASSARS